MNAEQQLRYKTYIEKIRRLASDIVQRERASTLPYWVGTIVSIKMSIWKPRILDNEDVFELYTRKAARP